MPNDQLDGLLNRLVSGSGEITGTELEQLRSAIFDTAKSEMPSALADIAAELDAPKDYDKDENVPCELQSAEDYLARVAAEDQPVPASLLRLIGAAPAIRSTAQFPNRRSRLAGLRSKHVLPWGSAIAASVLAGISGYFLHNLITRNPPAPSSIALPGDIADARAPQSPNSTVANTGTVPPQEPGTSANTPVPTLAVTPPIPTTSHVVATGDYPPESVRLQEHGTVKVRYLVLKTGAVGQCQVENSSGYPSLDDAACVMVKRWLFSPASLSDGTQVDWWLDASVVFNLVDGAAHSTPPQAPAVAAAKKDEGRTLRPAVGRPLNDAIRDTDAVKTAKNDAEKAKDFADALAKVKEADAVKDKTPYEEYQVAKFLGFIAINQPMPDYTAVAAAYNRQVASGGAPAAEKAGICKVAMRLNYQEKNFPEAIKDGVALQMLQPFDDTEYLIMLQSYYSTNDFANAVDMAKKEIAFRAAAGMKPSEDVLGLLLKAQTRINAQSGATSARGLQTKNDALVKAINDMNAAAKAQNWTLALEKAREADAIKDDKPAALNAPIHAMIISAAINAHDYAAALAELDKEIASGEGNRIQNLKQALGVAIMAKNKEKTDQYAKDLGSNLDNETRLFIASNMMNSGQLQEALDYAKPALERNPSEEALKFEEAVYFKMNNLAGRRAALEQLVANYPKLEYWHDLLQLARSDKGLSDDQIMDIYRLRLAVGDLKTDADFQEMAQEALVAGYATEAKDVLKKAQAENLLSGERDQRLVKMATDRAAQDGAAIADLQKRAGADPNSAVKLGLLYWSLGKDKEAEDTIRAAIARGNLADPGRAQMALGHALLSEGKNQDAIAAFQSVRGPNPAAVSIGAMWASYAVAPASSRPAQAPAVAVVQFAPFMRALLEASSAEVSHRWAECLEKAREAGAIKYDKSPGLNAEINRMIITCAVNSKDFAAALGQLDQNIATGEGNMELNLTLALTYATMSKNKEKADQYESQLTRLLAGIRSPVAINSHAVTADDYPPDSIHQQEQGNVMVMYLVNEGGSVDACNVIASSGYSRLDSAACVMVTKRWKFKPAMQNGKPVAGYLTAEVVFQLK